jgi:hypothetical protein
MGNDAGHRDTLSSGKRGYRKLLEAQTSEGREDELPSKDELKANTCPKKADPDRLWSGL